MAVCVMLPKVISPTELVSTSCSSKRVGTTLDNRLRTTIFDIHHSISYHIFEFHYKWIAKKSGGSRVFPFTVIEGNNSQKRRYPAFSSSSNVGAF